MRRLLWAMIAGLAVAVAVLGLARAANEGPPPSQREKATAIAAGLRCPTCQGLSVADSPSPIAEGMRKVVERQVAEGRDADEIRAYFVARYGEWVLLSPSRRGLNWLLWAVPGLAVAGGVLVATRVWRRRTPAPAPDEPALTQARELYAAHAAGQYQPEHTRQGERVESALLLLDSIREEDPDGRSPSFDDGLRRLAITLAGPEPNTATDPPHTAMRRLTRVQRVAAYAAGLAVFTAVLAGALAASLADRGAGGLPTGTPPGAAGPSTPPDVDELRALTRARPRDPAAWIALGRALDAQDQLAAAYGAYRRALDLDPDNAAARQLTAWALIRGRSPEEAIPLLRPLVAADAQDTHSLLLLGLAQHGAERPEAESTLRHYLKQEPDGPFSEEVRVLLEAD